MCTVTFLPRKTGYALGMNRDEKLARVTGLPPRRRKINGRMMLSPAEPGGGTWIAINDTGATLALINWYSIADRVAAAPLSRGEVVNAAGVAATPDLAAAALAGLPLARVNPFRLIGVFPARAEIIEWRWDLKKLVRKQHPWTAQQWISSGFDEPAAERVRSDTFQQAQRQRSAGTLDWLRRLHRSHSPASGPFSICMHRVDAATMSYTEIAVSPHQAVMRYHAGAPCRGQEHSLDQLSRVES